MIAAPLAVVVPLAGAALLAMLSSLRLRRTAEGVGIAAAAATACLSGWLAVHTTGGLGVYWFGGWRPHGGIALGIDFAVDPLGAGLACVAAILVTAALAFGAVYIEDLGQTLLQVLMLAVLAGITGFALSGDLFNMFVFFELMSVPAFALVSYMNDEAGPILGSVSFAVTNTLAALLALLGITLVYARTGALDLAQIGQSLAGHRPDGLVVAGFVLVAAGLLTKAAIAPFHLWLADAYAVAPAPVTIVFPGVLSEMGLYGLARIYWTAFSGPLGGHAGGLRVVLVGAGAATAVWGAVACLQAHHLKRMLALATVSHAGMFLTGLGLLDAEGLAGVAVWLVSDAFAKAALFMLAAFALRRLGGHDSRRLHGRGRSLPAAALFAAGGILLAAPPFSGAFAGKALVEHAASGLHGYGWLPWFLTAVSALLGAALLRAVAQIQFGGSGGGSGDEPGGSGEPARSAGISDRVLLLPAAMLAVSFCIGLVPPVAGAAARAAALAVDRPAYAATVLRGAPSPAVGAGVPSPEALDWSLAVAATAGVGAAAAGLVRTRRRAPALLRLAASAQTGHVGDYVLWMLGGVCVLAAACAVAVR